MTTVFKPLAVVTSVCSEDDLPQGATRDTVTLGWEDRVRARARRRSDRGLEFATALKRGTVLREGDWLVLDVPPVAVRVIEEAEPVLVVRPQSDAEWALFAYHIGNSHLPLMLAADGLVCPCVVGAEQVLACHRIPFSREDRPFTPVGQVPAHQHSVR
jgi:urease accessory protein